MKNKSQCCRVELETRDSRKRGLLWGIFYGIVPHSFCILFIILSVIGATVGAVFLKKFLILPYFFPLLITLSLVFVTISAWLYLRRCGNLSWAGAKRSWKYLSILYGATVGVGSLFFLVIFPYAANVDSKGKQPVAATDEIMNISVDIPCSGHAPLITGELKKLEGIKNIKYKLPGVFEIHYDTERTGPEEILALEIFQTYKATVKN